MTSAWWLWTFHLHSAPNPKNLRLKGHLKAKERERSEWPTTHPEPGETSRSSVRRVHWSFINSCRNQPSPGLPLIHFLKRVVGGGKTIRLNRTGIAQSDQQTRRYQSLRFPCWRQGNQQPAQVCSTDSRACGADRTGRPASGKSCYGAVTVKLRSAKAGA